MIIDLHISCVILYLSSKLKHNVCCIRRTHRSLKENDRFRTIYFQLYPSKVITSESRAIKVQATSGVAPVIYIKLYQASRRSSSILSHHRIGSSLRIDQNTWKNYNCQYKSGVFFFYSLSIINRDMYDKMRTCG